jgi:hypothetical protein
MVCDFCSEPSVICMWQIEPGGITGILVSGDEEITHVDRDGKWGACANCAEMIHNEDWTALKDRAIGNAPIPEHMRAIIGEAIVDGPHSCFRRGYHGQAPTKVITDAELLGHAE